MYLLPTFAFQPVDEITTENFRVPGEYSKIKKRVFIIISETLKNMPRPHAITKAGKCSALSITFIFIPWLLAMKGDFVIPKVYVCVYVCVYVPIWLGKSILLYLSNRMPYGHDILGIGGPRL